MDLTPVLRNAVPGATTALAPVSSQTAPLGDAAAVATPDRVANILPPRSAGATASVQLAQADADHHPAAVARTTAAEAARAAYIRASMAAGISPLPLPGV